ncbi:cyclopropane-fatty-acyl-phospholipid synthase family protein [Magnetospirillum sp. UT-4]|uniref:SAM-dependent methyltransferase n=1 Tax=Magnetospirillum sp. UT-4 TaxID=2681467 RepID=UPI00137F658F|nr:cyclopropane-fatty-acyl-phospholipid synthase family protein [Magnetospirillum sp. UT-4]CAA7626091.1 Cyclopropane fatty acyl phospholipid synthase (Unsaturated-phospholipid methyltransferase) [Magnetospirillum sp. UT-4]
MDPLDLLFTRLIRRQSLRVVDHEGRSRDYGDHSAPRAVVRVTDPGTARRIARSPHYHLLEAFTEGTLVVEEGGIYDLLDVCALNLAEGGSSPWHRLYRAAGTLALLWENYNPAQLARRRVSRHYDLSGDLFRLFLDSDLNYSCAYFAEAGMSLEAAQAAKQRHIAAKLALADGQRVLDIGSGWGSLALALARMSEVEVVGITLSEEQLGVARRRAAEAGLAGRVRFELMDYRKLSGRFDRIVSVGMFEHVGRLHYRAFFRKVHEVLAEDGIALLHSIGEFDRGGSHPWMRRHIFPGSYTPSCSQVLRAVERSDLLATDLEIQRLHYADTLRAWRERFLANRAQAADLYDERFCRMWEAYLAAAEVGFRRLSLMVFQLQMAKRRDVLPLTRDYMVEAERRLESGAERRAAE